MHIHSYEIIQTIFIPFCINFFHSPFILIGLQSSLGKILHYLNFCPRKMCKSGIMFVFLTRFYLTKPIVFENIIYM